MNTATNIAIDLTNGISFQIPLDNMEKFEKSFNRLSKKAGDLLGKPFELIKGEKENVVFESCARGKQVVTVRNITILGASIPMIDGWSFAGSIIHQMDDNGNMINVIKSMLPEGVSFPLKYRSDKPQCDHCEIKRFRRHSYIVYNPTTLEFKQVGKQCLRDYTGNKDILAIASLLENLMRERDENEFGMGYGGRSEDIFKTSFFLSVTLGAIRAFGYVSSQEARGTDKTATRDHVMRYMYLVNKPKNKYEQEFVSEVEKFIYTEDQAHIEQIIEHFQFSDKDSDSLNDYEYNCYAVVQSGYVFRKTAGIAVSMVGSYEKALIAKRANEFKATSKYFGNIKDTFKLTVEVLNSISYIGQYGTMFTVFMRVKDTNAGIWNNLKGKKGAYLPITVLENNVVAWSTNGSSADLNVLLRAIHSKKDVSLIGTVKQHYNYKDSGDVTYLTRCSASFLEGDPILG